MSLYRKYLTKYQVEEGELLIRERNAKKNLHDAKLINRNRRAITEYNIRLIQRCCKKWLKRKRMNHHATMSLLNNNVNVKNVNNNRNNDKVNVVVNTNDVQICTT